MGSARDILHLAVLLLAAGAAVGAGCIGGDGPPAGPGTTGGADESGAEDIEVVASALRNGQSCTRSRQCDSGHCVDGHCCNTACTGTCRTCATGTCAIVTNADDPNTCTGTLTCNAVGICAGKPGQVCSAASQCASGFCVDGHCCSSSCTGTCRTCATGTCAIVTNADDPNTCTGALTCNAVGICVGKPGQVCSAASQCASGFCVDGRCCSSACNGVCQTCATPTGTCTIVTSADDNTCTGTLTCNAAGVCVSK